MYYIECELTSQCIEFNTIYITSWLASMQLAIQISYNYKQLHIVVLQLMGGAILTCTLCSYSYLLAVYQNLSYLASSNNYSYCCQLSTSYSYSQTYVWFAIVAIHFSVPNYYSHCKSFIELIFVGCYPQRKFFTCEISATYSIQYIISITNSYRTDYDGK